MLEASGRLLRLLGLLQANGDWAGGELAGRLGVSARTPRRDIGKLRELGYRVDAVGGVGGGYRMAPGSGVPPLLLDDEEAVAVAVGLRTASGSGCGSTTPRMAEPGPYARLSRTGWATAGGSGTSSPGTPRARTGGVSAPTG